MTAVDELADFWVHTVQVETFQGSGPYGAVYTEPADATGFLEAGRRLVRASDGTQVVAESTWFGPASTAALFTPDSRVTLPDGTQPTVITAKVHDAGDLPLPEHVEVALT